MPPGDLHRRVGPEAELDEFDKILKGWTCGLFNLAEDVQDPRIEMEEFK